MLNDRVIEKSSRSIKKLSDIEVLNKAGIMIKGKVTRTALLLLAVDKVYSKIRNEKYRYIAGQQTLFPDEVDQYEPELIKEILFNCIAHQD